MDSKPGVFASLAILIGAEMTQQEHLDTGNAAFSTGDDGPQGETEITVGRVFAEMLGISGLPRTASFFDLGLDSLSVTLACARLEQATGVRIRFSQLFRTPTVAQLAEWIDAALDRPKGGPGIRAKTSAYEGAELVAITPMQAETVPADIVVQLGWWFDSEIDDAALEIAASDIHRRHQALHARYLDGPDLGLAELPADPGQAQFHRLRQEDSDADAKDALWRTLGQPLHLGEGEVWRCAIVRSRQSGRTLFGMAVHHAAFDGHSLNIFTAELSAAYSARAATAPRWPGRVASLAEMAADYRHQLVAQDADAQRRYWHNELRGLPACHLPGHNDAPAPHIGPASARAFTVSNAQLRIWEDYCRANGMSASVGMAAAYVQAIIRAGGPRDFGLMVGFANRASEIIDRTITNRVGGGICLRANGPLRSGPNILARMRDSYRQAMAERDVVLDLKEQASVSNGGRPDGALNFHGLANMIYNPPPPALGLGGVAGTLLPEIDDWDVSVYDLMLVVVPESEGLRMDMIVRTDIYEASLADRLSRHFIDIINDGPERLELETAR